MKIRATWTAPVRFDATCEGGGAITMDMRRDRGGANHGPTPMETVLMAMAGCTGVDVATILAKMRAPVHRLHIAVDGKQSSEHPKVFTAIHVRFDAAGPGLPPEQVEKAVALSIDKYCPVTAMLKRSAKVTYEVRVSDAA
jgi:putative redox protein